MKTSINVEAQNYFNVKSRKDGFRKKFIEQSNQYFLSFYPCLNNGQENNIFTKKPNKPISITEGPTD